MTGTVLLLGGAVAALLLWRRFFGARSRWPLDSLVRDHIVFLNRNRARSGGAILPSLARTDKEGAAAVELRRRGFDPDILVDEVFAARHARRAPAINENPRLFPMGVVSSARPMIVASSTQRTIDIFDGGSFGVWPPLG